MKKPTSKTEEKVLYELIQETNKKGLYLNNLFQMTEVMWRCNLREGTGGGAFDFGQGATPLEALSNAVKKAEGEKSKAKAKAEENDDYDFFS